MAPEITGLCLVRWTEIRPVSALPPFGDAFAAHIGAYRNAAGRAASVSAWTLLYETLLEAGLPSGTVAFTDRGKPYFTDSPVCFSLSHGGDVAAVSLSDAPTGVDVERCDRPVRPGIAARCVTEAESAALGGDFFRLWCRKECIVKLTGEGLAGFPIGVDALDARYRFRETRLQTRGGVYQLTAAFSAARRPE